MCRLYSNRYEKPHNMVDELYNFSMECKNSKEYQGDGFGIIYYDGDTWNNLYSLNPIWEYPLDNLPDMEICLVHARSAFDDEIVIENNMPFENERYAFIFNGELRGVKIKSPGRIGAEKIFNFILRFSKYTMYNAIYRAMDIIENKSEFIRGCNFIIVDKITKERYVYSKFNEDEEYFTLHTNQNYISSIKKMDTDTPIPTEEVITL